MWHMRAGPIGRARVVAHLKRALYSISGPIMHRKAKDRAAPTTMSKRCALSFPPNPVSSLVLEDTLWRGTGSAGSILFSLYPFTPSTPSPLPPLATFPLLSLALLIERPSLAAWLVG